MLVQQMQKSSDDMLARLEVVYKGFDRRTWQKIVCVCVAHWFEMQAIVVAYGTAMIARLYAEDEDSDEEEGAEEEGAEEEGAGESEEMSEDDGLRSVRRRLTYD
ncbi:Uu.00g118010.m01.CDS01 [Anthostomella pinea]|uniref:Uu.00g118010.m01.CDS01 n=1 Tax=Anthostomella pinea TaxID=933095 RepID=A0AAI8VGD2_9PEZI|nr:Uu.00g118010.m01.CDS01 [Anthostomella pinea]